MDDDEQMQTTTNEGKKSADGDHFGLNVRRAVSSDAGGTRVVLRVNKLSA